MVETMAETLRSAAGPDLFRLNAFRITGLPATADRIAIHGRHERATAAGRPDDVDPDTVRAACTRLLRTRGAA